MIGKVPFILLLFVAAVIAAATFVEQQFGTPFAHQHFYGVWWFIVLWMLVVFSGCWLMFRVKMWQRLPVFMLHISLVLILVGALTTHLTSRRGMLHLREGEVTRNYWAKDSQDRYVNMEELPFYLALKDFRIQYDADGQTYADYISEVVLSSRDGEQETTISMNNIARVSGWRIYQTSFDDDEQGSTFTVSYDPWGTAITYSAYLLLALSMIGVSLKKQDNTPIPRKEGLGVSLLLSFIAIIMSSYMIIAICHSPLVPVLRSPYLFFHVGTICLSYILLVVSIVSRSLLRPAVFLLATGIFLGAVWANVSWGTYWSWDPKESWALVTLLIYSLPLHEKSLPWFRSQRNYRLYSLIALASLLMTYFGVTYLLGGLHSYA